MMLELKDKKRTEKTSDSAVLTTVLLARQPIYNQTMGVHAYQLLFRAGKSEVGYVGEDNATAQLLLNAFLNMGLDSLVGSRLVSVSISESFMYKARALPIPPAQVILEIPSTIEVNTQALDVLKDLHGLGFTLALGRFTYREALKSVFPYIDILKMDGRRYSNDQITHLIKQFSKYSTLKYLVHGVESLDEYRRYCDLGIDYCQGNLLSKPRVYQSGNLSASKVALVNLLSVLHKPDVDFSEVEQYVNYDVSISYKLLKLINSAFFALPRPVESIQQAVVLLGQEQLRGWISMLAMSGLGTCPQSIIEAAVVRAKMCELLAKASGLPWPDSFFTVGMLSTLDVLMQQPLPKLINGLPLSDEVKKAILWREGVMGKALNCVIAFENSDWEFTVFEKLTYEEISKLGYKAILWSTEFAHRI